MADRLLSEILAVGESAPVGVPKTFTIDDPDRYYLIYDEEASVLTVDGETSCQALSFCKYNQRGEMAMPLCTEVLVTVLEHASVGSFKCVGGATSQVTRIEAASLVDVAGSFVISKHPLLTNPARVNVSSLVAVPKHFVVSHTGLTGFTMPTLTTVPERFFFGGNAFTESAINALIIQLDSMGATECVFKGGTNAAPTGSALAIADSHGWPHN